MIYLILFLFSFVLTYFIKNYAIKKALVAQVNERSSHTVPTPHGGGIAIAITWFIGLSYIYYMKEISLELYYALLIGSIISLVSFFDDLYELSAKLRLIAQAIVSILGLIAIGGFDSLSFGFFTIENQIVTNIFAFFLIIWFINLYNFLDGINGYAGAQAVFLGIAGFLIFSGNHFLVLIVSVLGFLLWNYNKAKIFMGDVGSTLLGYNIAIFTLYYANETSYNFWVWIALFSLFWFDATITLIRRKINGERLSEAHKKHAYQRITQSSWSHFKTVNYAMLINVFILLLLFLENNIFIVNAIIYFILLIVYFLIERKKSFN